MSRARGETHETVRYLDVLIIRSDGSSELMFHKDLNCALYGVLLLKSSTGPKDEECQHPNQHERNAAAAA